MHNSVIILLQNHGIIISDNSAESTLALHEEVNKKIITHFDLAKFQQNESPKFDTNFMKMNVLFPDQIVLQSCLLQKYYLVPQN